MKEKKKKISVVLLLVVLLGITVGFALLSTTLKINGTAAVKSNNWDVYWDSGSINVNNQSVSADLPEVDEDKTTVTYEVTLELPGDFYEFTIDAVNNGSIDAMVTDVGTLITDLSDEETTLPSYIHYSITYGDNIPIAKDHLLPKKEGNTPSRETYKVRIEFDSNATTLPATDSSYKITTTVKYGQANKSAKRRYPVYNLSDVVYFDPVSTDPCDSTTYDITKINNNESTCYKWRVIETNDVTTNENIKLQLDHSIINTHWATTSTVTSGPNELLPNLATATSTWTRVPLLNFSYDTTVATPYNYGVLTCTAGACKITKDNTDTDIATGVRARIITGEEVTAITKTLAPNLNWTLATDYCHNNDGKYYFANTYYEIGTYDTIAVPANSGNTQLSWLLENTKANVISGATNNAYGANITEYWTLSTVNCGQYYPYYLADTGIFEANTGTGNSPYGARPVISISKNNIVK